MREAPERVGHVLGVGCIVLGGLVAAMARPLNLALGSWLAAYLVLVCGVAQCVIAEQRRLCRTPTIARNRQWAMFALWNVANVVIIAGSLFRLPVITDLGGVLLIMALVLAAAATRHSAHRRTALLVRLLHALLMISIPIGLVLAQLRASAG